MGSIPAGLFSLSTLSEMSLNRCYNLQGYLKMDSKLLDLGRNKLKRFALETLGTCLQFKNIRLASRSFKRSLTIKFCKMFVSNWMLAHLSHTPLGQIYIAKTQKDWVMYFLWQLKPGQSKWLKLASGGLAKHRGTVRASHPAAPVRFLAFPRTFLPNFSEEIYSWCCWDLLTALLRVWKPWICWSNHLVLVRGKLVLQKTWHLSITLICTLWLSALALFLLSS